ncbi:MAG: hypothetical protein AAF843_20090 [Bacteroidota bacterium]
MKNEDEIVGLLVESVRRQDRQEEILEQHTSILTELVKGQKELIYRLHEANDHL